MCSIPANVPFFFNMKLATVKVVHLSVAGVRQEFFSLNYGKACISKHLYSTRSSAAPIYANYVKQLYLTRNILSHRWSSNKSYVCQKFADVCFRYYSTATRDVLLPTANDLHSDTESFETAEHVPLSYRQEQSDLQKFLSEVGTDAKEARYWLKYFRSSSSRQKPFAILHIDDAVFQDKRQVTLLCSNLSFLQRNHMKLVVVLGQNLLTAWNGSLNLEQRVTMRENNMTLIKLLDKYSCRPLLSWGGAFNISSSDSNPRLVFNTDLVSWAIESNTIPILQTVAELDSGQLVAVSCQEAISCLARTLQPLKILFVNSSGGFTNSHGSIVANINLPADLSKVCGSNWCTADMKRQISAAENILQLLPRQSSLVIASATSLLTELFTHKGSGTFFKIVDQIVTHKSLDTVDCQKLKSLIELGFSKKLHPDYFSTLKEKVHTIYIMDGYSGAAIITQEAGVSIPYLDKFVVCSTRQGENTAEILWDMIRQDFAELFWRSRKDNHTINPWYFKRSVGSRQVDRWIVFWYGSIGHQQSCDLIDYAVSLPSTLE